MNELIRRLRIYLDTSVPNCLFVADFRLPHTVRFWENCQADMYDIFVSDVFLDELGDCPQPKLDWMRKRLDAINYVVLKETEEVQTLAIEYIKAGVFREQDYNDGLHVAYAVIAHCDFVVSWNFTHLVKRDTIEGVKVVNAINRYKAIGIAPPAMF